jgi:hypothetical protein
MKRFQSILCASLLTAALSSTAFAGQISGTPGQISGKPGQISGKPGQISGKPGQISGLPWSVIESIITLVVGI